MKISRRSCKHAACAATRRMPRRCCGAPPPRSDAARSKVPPTASDRSLRRRLRLHCGAAGDRTRRRTARSRRRGGVPPHGVPRDATAFRVLRFWNNDVLGDLDGVLETDRSCSAAVDDRPHPPRSLARAVPSLSRWRGRGRYVPYSTLSCPRERVASGSEPGEARSLARIPHRERVHRPQEFDPILSPERVARFQCGVRCRQSVAQDSSNSKASRAGEWWRRSTAGR